MITEVVFEVVESTVEPGVWVVEAICPDGGVWKTNFYGPDSEERAREYAELKNVQ